MVLKYAPFLFSLDYKADYFTLEMCVSTRNHYLITVEVCICLSTIVSSLNTITKPQWLLDIVCHDIFNTTVCSDINSLMERNAQDVIHKKTAQWNVILIIVTTIPAIFTTPIFGVFADKFGKKQAMIIPPFVSLLQSITYLSLSLLPLQELSPSYLLLPAIMGGVFDDIQGIKAIAIGYISAITSEKQRTCRLSVLTSVYLLSYAIGLLSSGVLLTRFDYKSVFALTTVSNTVNLLYTIILLPSENKVLEKFSMQNAKSEEDNCVKEKNAKVTGENQHSESTSDDEKAVDAQAQQNSPDMSKTQNTRTHNLIVRIKQALSILNPFSKRLCSMFREDAVRCSIALTVLLICVGVFAEQGETYVGILFVKHYPFNMSYLQVAYFGAFMCCLRGIGAFICVYVLQECISLSDYTLIIVGFIFQCIYFLLFSLSQSTLMLYLIQIVSMLTTTHLTALRSKISKEVRPTHITSAIAAFQTIDLVATMCVGCLSGLLYSVSVEVFTGLPFLIMSFISLVAVFMSIGLSCLHRPNEETTEETALLQSDKK